MLSFQLHNPKREYRSIASNSRFFPFHHRRYLYLYTTCIANRQDQHKAAYLERRAAISSPPLLALEAPLRAKHSCQYIPPLPGLLTHPGLGGSDQVTWRAHRTRINYCRPTTVDQHHSTVDNTLPRHRAKLFAKGLVIPNLEDFARAMTAL
jgi:hypothetical protein